MKSASARHLRLRWGTLLTLVVLMAGCGPSPAGPPATTVSGSAPSAGPAATPVPVDLQMSYTAGNPSDPLGPHCPKWIDRTDQLVLSSSRLTYSQAEVEQIVSALAHGVNRSIPLAGSPLRYVSGVSTTAALGLKDTWSATLNNAPACTVELELANVGTTTIQVLRVGFRYTTASVANPTIYRLVDYCSVIQLEPCPGGFGAGPGSCSVYAVHVKLAAGQAGSTFLAQPHAEDAAGQMCPGITLSPGANVSFEVDVYSPDPMLYHAVPALDLLTASGHQAVAFPGLVSIYAFADPMAFACYRLEGNTFVARWNGLAALDFMALAKQHAWCL